MMRKTKALVLWIGSILIVAGVGAWISVTLAQNSAVPASVAAAGVYRSPFDVAFSPDGKLLAVSDRTAGEVVVLAGGKVTQRIPLAKPGGLTWSANGELFAVDYQNAAVAQIDPTAGKIIRKLPTGVYPISAAIANKKQLLLVTNSGLADVSVIDLRAGKEIKKIHAIREPFWVAVSPDESTAVVSNLLPAGSAAEALITAAVSIIDLAKMERVADVPLPPNTTAIRHVAISPDGKWAYAVHTVGRTTLPATQLERGWVNTNALSVIDLKTRQLYASVLLDTLSEGAADPWGIAISKDGNTMWISLAGVHQIAKIDLAGLHKGLAGQLPPAIVERKLSQQTIWSEIKSDANKRAELVNDLAAMYVADLIVRTNIPGKAPRGISLSPDGARLAVGMYYSGQIFMLDPKDSKVAATLELGPQKPADAVRQGEAIVHDATYSFQHWLSCATCHPNQARTDGLNWDLPNDGIGNPKSAKSLLYAHRTPPLMWTGVRDDMESAAMAGFRFNMYQPQSEEVRNVQAYLRTLKPEPSPYLVSGKLSSSAQRGKAVYEDAIVGCTHCHSGEYHTNQKSMDIGTHGPLDHEGQNSFVTPPLVELWRTAPYLHDGRAATMAELFTKHNPKDQHGKTSHLTREQIEDLAEYLLSI